MRTEVLDIYCLIVDDDQDCQLIAQKIVERMGFKTRIAGSGKEAIALARGYLPRVVMLDLNMPDIDGLGFMAELMRIPSGGKVPVIMCTGEASQQKVQVALESGAKGYLVKPFSDQDVAKQFARLRIRPTTTIL